MEAFSDLARESFEARMEARLLDDALKCDACMDPADFARFVSKGVAAALAYGLKCEVEVERFLRLGLDLGEDFFREPAFEWIGRILDERLTEPMHRLDRIERRLTFGRMSARRKN